MATNTMEMQYQPAEPMHAQAPEQSSASTSDVENQSTEQPKKQRTFLGMRGGGIILDMCACFICCECMEGCCHAVDDCCCC